MFFLNQGTPRGLLPIAFSCICSQSAYTFEHLMARFEDHSAYSVPMEAGEGERGR